jgi:tellurite methyltransferase
MSKYYDDRYGAEAFYWGKRPSSMARIFFQKYPPQDDQKLLDIGCGEGRDSIFFAQNGYQVTGFDASAEGIRKSSATADELKLSIDFFQADINEYRLHDSYDAIFASGALHYIPMPLRDEIISNYKRFTHTGGIHAFMVPIHKPFLPANPQADQLEQPWRSGEILTHYHDWKIEFFSEEILDDIRSGYKFPFNRLIAREPSGLSIA